MGLGNEDYGKTTYLSIAHGKLKYKIQSTDEEMKTNPKIAKTEKDGKVNFWMTFDNIEGYLTGIYFKKADNPDYDNQFHIQITDTDGERYNIAVGTSSPYWESIFNIIFKIDFSKQVKLKPYDFKTKTKDGGEISIIGTTVYQDGAKLATDGFIYASNEAGRVWIDKTRPQQSKPFAERSKTDKMVFKESVAKWMEATFEAKKTELDGLISNNKVVVEPKTPTPVNGATPEVDEDLPF